MPELVDRLAARAAANGRSLEEEVKHLLEEAAFAPYLRAQEKLEQLRARFAGRTFSDSAELIREDRER